MKVLHVNISDVEGGASIAAYRLHRALIKAGVESLMLVRTKQTDDYTVIGPSTQFDKAKAKVITALDLLAVKRYKTREKAPFSSSRLSFGWLLKKIKELDPDVVHYHFICRGGIGISSFPAVKKPTVWSLHDMWAFTGGCHYDMGCGRFTSECGNCPVLKSGKPSDLSRRIFRNKQKAYGQIDNLTVVGLSKWMADTAASSKLLQGKRILNLPNTIDTDTFTPIDKSDAREILHLINDGRKYILFGAVSPTSDPRKGYHMLLKALAELRFQQPVELIIFGSSEPAKKAELGFPVHYTGFLHDEVSLRILYSAADVMVAPSLQENLSNAILEAMACATPVVAFNIGGNSDLIDHKLTGYLAKENDTNDLAAGITWALGEPNAAIMARKKAASNFNNATIARKYIELYYEMMSKT